MFADPQVRLPIGFNEGRLVWEGNSHGSKQRDWPEEKRPADCKRMSEEEVKAEVKRRYGV